MTITGLNTETKDKPKINDKIMKFCRQTMKIEEDVQGGHAVKRRKNKVDRKYAQTKRL